MMTMKSFQPAITKKKQVNRSSLFLVTLFPHFLVFRALQNASVTPPGGHRLASSPMRQFSQSDLRVLRVGRSSPEGPKIQLGGEGHKEGSWSVDSKAGAFFKSQKAPYGRLYSLIAMVGVVPFALGLRTGMRLRLPLSSYGLRKRRARSQARSCEFCIENLPRI